MAITIRPVGGLGNQLFTYAAGSTLANRLGVELWADIQHFDSNPLRTYLLDRFASRVTRTFRPEEARPENRMAKAFARPFRRVLKLPEEAVRHERGFWFDPEILEVPDGTTITGYLQSWKYFFPDSERLRNEIKSPSTPSQWFMKMHQELESSKPWIGLHIRRGDYLDIPRMGIATNYYYDRALSLVEKLSGVSRIIVFSDDPARAREIPSIQTRKNVEFFEAPADSCPLENLVLLSLSSHLIGANSSFSWWASWLSDREERVVTYPRPWIDFRFINDRDLPLPNWIGLGREDSEAARLNHVGY